MVYSRQVEEVIQFVKHFQNQKFVIDHIAKTHIKEKEYTQWAKNMAEFASFENLYCMLSGMVTEADWKNCKTDNFKPYLDQVIKIVVIYQLIYGSDWPVCLVASSYKQQLSNVEDFISNL